jgi:hypothetical protein
MLICRGCNTRYQSGRTQCPSCGRSAKTHAVESNADSGSSLPPMKPNPEETVRGDDIDAGLGVDVEVDDSVIEDDDGPELEEPEKEEVIPVRTRSAPAPVPAPAPKPAPPARAAAARPAGPPSH